MVSLPLARQLKNSGVAWTPRPNDFFAIPDRGLDERVFVISEIMTNIEKIRGSPMVTFHGSAEWATDYLVTSEVVWLPRESQIRELLSGILSRKKGIDGTGGMTQGEIHLRASADSCTCRIDLKTTKYQFKAQNAADAYALAYLYVREIDNH